MKKEVMLAIVILFVIYGGIAAFLITSMQDIPEISLSPLTVFGPDRPQNCNFSSTFSLWTSVFEGAAVVVTRNETSHDDRCEEFFLYDATNYAPAIRTIYGTDDGTTFDLDVQHIEFTQSDFDNVITPNLTETDAFELSEFFFDDVWDYVNATERSLSLGEADIHYREVFENTPPSWETETSGGDILYTFEQIQSNSTERRNVYGAVNGNQTITFSSYTLTFTQGCVPDWTSYTTDCVEGETNITYYRDSNNCNNMSTYPGNRTNDCDYDGNGIIGDEGDIADTNIEVSVYIDDEELNSSHDYEDELEVRLREGSVTRVSFDHDFDATPLNLRAIVVKKQTSSASRGYLIVNGINDEKTFRVDKKNSTSDQICIEDKNITSISSISDDCDESGEHLLDCPDTSSGFGCSISGDYFIVTGLDHSAVEEFAEGTSTACTPNWDCTDWSTCTNGQQTKTCTDLNFCNTTSGKPPESQSCGDTCTTVWNCTAWAPSTCPRNQTQTRFCTDNNNCQSDKSETRTCEFKSHTLLIIIIVVGVLLAGALITLFYLMKNKPQATPSSNLAPPSVIQQPPPPTQGQDPFNYQQPFKVPRRSF